MAAAEPATRQDFSREEKEQEPVPQKTAPPWWSSRFATFVVAAIFSVVHALLVSPLRYHDAERLVQIQSVHPEQGVSVLAPATAEVAARPTPAALRSACSPRRHPASPINTPNATDLTRPEFTSDKSTMLWVSIQ